MPSEGIPFLPALPAAQHGCPWGAQKVSNLIVEQLGLFSTRKGGTYNELIILLVLKSWFLRTLAKFPEQLFLKKWSHSLGTFPSHKLCNCSFKLFSSFCNCIRSCSSTSSDVVVMEYVVFLASRYIFSEVIENSVDPFILWQSDTCNWCVFWEWKELQDWIANDSALDCADWKQVASRWPMNFTAQTDVVFF